MHETQKTISEWANKIFGIPDDNAERIMWRMLMEADELKEKLLSGEEWHSNEVADEIADIFIVGYQCFTVLGMDAQECIDRKMKINRARKWKLNGDGTGQHIKE